MDSSLPSPAAKGIVRSTPPRGRYANDFTASPTLTTFLNSLSTGSPLRGHTSPPPVVLSPGGDENFFSSSYYDARAGSNFNGMGGVAHERVAVGSTLAAVSGDLPAPPHLSRPQQGRAPDMTPLQFPSSLLPVPAPGPVQGQGPFQGQGQGQGQGPGSGLGPVPAFGRVGALPPAIPARLPPARPQVKLEQKSQQYLQQFHLLQQQHQQILQQQQKLPIGQQLPMGQMPLGQTPSFSSPPAMPPPFRQQLFQPPQSFAAKLEPADMVDEDGKSALSAGAVNAARARKRINESFKHLADLCGCSRSKKPSILISAIDKIQRLEATVRQMETTSQETESDKEVLAQDLRTDSFLPSSPENVTSAAIIRSIAQLSRIPATYPGPYEWSEDYQHIFENGNMCMLVLAPSKKVFAMNKQACQLLGYSPQEVQDLTVFEVTHPSSVRDTLLVNAGFYSKPHTLHRYSCSYTHKDGHEIPSLATTWVSFDGAGDLKWSHVVVEPVKVSLLLSVSQTDEELPQSMTNTTLSPPPHDDIDEDEPYDMNF